MKVLHLIDSGGLYGAEKMLLTLVTEQIKQGLEPMILSAGEPGIEEKAIEGEAKRLNLPITPWRMKPGLNLSETTKILSWAESNGYKLLHSHGYKFNILLGLVCPRGYGARFVATIHGYTTVRRSSRLGIYQLLDRWMLRRADAVAVVSKELQSKFGKKLSVDFIPNGISEKSPLAESIAEKVPDGRYLVAIGRLSAEKAFDRLVEAFHGLNDPELHLILVGDGTERNYLEGLVRQKDLKNRVHFVGYSNNPTPFIQAAEALVISSVTEGMPLTLLEAMRAGIPVVSTPVGEIPGVLGLGNYGYLTPGLSSDDIKDTLLTVLSDLEGARRKAVAAKREFLENYTANKMAGRYADLYRRLGLKK